MLDRDRVFFLFCFFCELEGQETEPWRWLADQAAQSIEKRILPGVGTASEMEQLCIAAAACACSEFMMLRPGQSLPADLKVGDISVRAGQVSPMDPEFVKNYFLSSVSHLLLPSHGFVFVRTPGSGSKP